MKSTSIMIIRCTLFVVLFTFVCLPAFGEEKKVPDAAQEEARQILQELQHRFQDRPPYQLSFLTKFELLGGTRAKISVNQGDKPVTYYTVEGLVRLSGEKIETYSVSASLNNDFQKGTERHSVWQDGRAFELRKYKSGREEAVTTRVKLHDKIRLDSRGWFADGVFIGSNHFSEDLLGVPELKIARETGIAGGELLRIEGEIPSGTLVVWLNIEKPATLKRASFKANSNFMSQLHDVNAFNLEVEVLEYTKIGEGPFPTKAVATYTYEIPGEPVKLVERLTTTRREIQVNPDFGSMNAFQIDFPEGMIVEDYGANVKYKWVRGKLQVIEGEPIPLTGKALPELKDLGIDLSPADVDDKVILVCFFDMEQRPSRNCLRRLSEQARELKAKDAVIVAVQVSKIDGNTLSRWVKKNNIPFPVGMVQGDEANTRFAWAVKSLPWLILTNKERIVRAVGFGIADLDEKLASIHKRITKEEIEKHQREGAEVEIRRLGGEIIVKTSENGSEYTEVKFLGPRYQNEWRGGNWGAKYLNDLANVRKLRIQDVETFTDEGMEHLKGLRNLESLMLVGTGVSDDGLVHLKDLTNLEFLGLMSSRFTDTGLEYIIGMTNLKSLRLDDAQITDEGLRTLKQDGLLTGLEFLVLNRTKITDAGFTHLQGMDQLKWLYFGETQIGDEGMTHLAGLSNLEKIILNKTNVTDAGLAHLKGLKNLNLLYLRNTQVTDAGLEHLRELANLVELGLGCTNITDAGLVHIRGLTNLQTVGLDSTRVTDEGLAYLKSLTALNELFLNQSDITFDGYMDLKEALPNCQIHWEENKGEGAGAARGKTGRKRTEELKSVIVVAAQASKVDENVLNEWVKKYKIPFPVGMIQADEEKTRFAWGVRSLPWLILTDREYVVTAEGFQFSELNEKLKHIDEE